MLFSSSIIPGNERAVHGLHNALARRGVRVIDGDTAGLHVSGHAGRNELRRLYELLRPTSAVPIHGEPRHLMEHAEFARSCGVANVVVTRNGEEIAISKRGLRRVGERECGRIYREGKLLLPEGQGVIRERRTMSHAGHVSIGLVLDERGALLAPALVETRGAPTGDSDWPDSLPNMIAVEVEDALDRMSRAARTDEAEVERTAVRAARNVTRERWGRRPLVTVLASFVD